MNTYLVVSETIYYTDKFLNDLKGDIKNIVTFNMDENSIDDVLTEASYFSMFDEEKCVIVKNARFFLASKTNDSKKNTEICEKILKYLEEENKNTKLIFVLNGKVDSKKKLYKYLLDNEHVLISPSMTKTDMKNELFKICKENKYSILDKSLWHIINNSDNNFDLAYNELKKIMLYYSKPCDIKYEDVLALTSKTLEENNFKLVDSIISRDLDNSLKLINELKIFKVEPSVIIALIYREFKLMLLTILYQENNCSTKEILSNLHLADWMFDKVQNNLKKYRKDEIKKEIIKLSTIDYKIKSGNLNKDVALISYVIDLCL